MEIHLVLGFLVVIAFSSSSKAPGYFFIFFTSCRIAFSQSLLWFDSDELVTRFEPPGDASSSLVCIVPLLSKFGLILKPKSFFTIAGVIYKFEKWVVSMDILSWWRNFWFKSNKLKNEAWLYSLRALNFFETALLIKIRAINISW